VERHRLVGIVMAVLTVWTATSCSVASRGSGGPPDLRGQRLEVLAVWSGSEQEAFTAVLRRFEQLSGASVTYSAVGRGMAAALDARVADGRPPDIAFLPQPGLLRRYAHEGRLVQLDESVAATVERNYNEPWRALGSVDGRRFGVWFKAANKSLIWYNLGVFERLGVVPPEDLDGLLRLAATLADAGLPAFSVAGGEGWTLTDWFENLYLRLAGPELYDRLARHEIPWTHDSVKAGLRLFDRVLDDRFLAGGVEGARATRFESSVQAVLAEPPAAAMVFEGDFVAGVVRSATRAQVGVDVDAFAFPRIPPIDVADPSTAGAVPVVGGGDAAVLLRPSAAGTALLRFLAEPEAAAIWAARGGFVSPNRNLDLAAYPDETSRSLARNLLEAGDALGFDLSDLAPASFGGIEGHGLRAGLQEHLRTRNIDATTAGLEAAASIAFGR
jgi:alpha-glucoside transport system substrate-binding protein